MNLVNLRFDGSQAILDINEEGGPCGLWVEQHGKPVVELQPEDSEASRISRQLLFADDNRESVLKREL